MKKFIPEVFVVLVVLFLLVLVKPAFQGGLSGTFKHVEIPSDYLKLEKFLSSQDSFFRVLWIPSTQRFGYYTIQHPAVLGSILFEKYDQKSLIAALSAPGVDEKLSEIGVKYLIVPFDTAGEIFLKDRKYDQKQYEDYVSSLRKINWLNEVDGFGNVHVFEIKNAKDRFWSPDSLSVEYESINPTSYIVDVKGAKKGDMLVFNERYNRDWYVKKINGMDSGSNNTFYSIPYKGDSNSFILFEDGDFKLEVFYKPQKYVQIGLIVSLTTVLVLIAYFVIRVTVKYRKR